MSWQATAWVDSLEYDLGVGPLAFRVLLKFANAAAPDGTRAFLSKATLAEQLGVSQRSIQRAFKDLAAARLIRRGNQEFVSHVPVNRRPTVYDLVMPSDRLPETFQNDEPAGSIEPLPGETGRGDKVIHRGDNLETSGETTTVVHKNHHRTTTKTEIDTSRPERARARKASRFPNEPAWGHCPDGHEMLDPRVWGPGMLRTSPRCRDESATHSIPQHRWHDLGLLPVFVIDRYHECYPEPIGVST